MSTTPLPPFAANRRNVSWLARCAVLLGGQAGQGGWLVLGFSLIFVWMFVLNSEVTTLFRFRGTLNTVTGTVTQVTATSFSEGGNRRHRGTSIYEIQYLYVVASNQYAGVSYRLGAGVSPGKPVTVEFKPAAPAMSRIQGLRTKPFTTMAGLVIVFPLVGIGLITARWRAGLRGLRLLQEGNLAEGVFRAAVRANVSVNHRPLYKVTYEFQTNTGERHSIVIKTTRPQLREENTKIRVAYDPLCPAKAVVIDALPGKLQFDALGNVEPGNAFGTTLLFILPALTILGHGAYLLMCLIE